MIKKFLLVLVCSSFLLTGCENLLVKSLLPEEIVEAAIDTNKDIEDYYIESTMKVYEGDTLIEDLIIKEWNAKIDGDAKRMTEINSDQTGKVVALIEKDTLNMYDEKQNEVYNIGNIGDINSNLAKSLKEKTKNELDTMNNAYSMETVGEETINGVKTYHIKGSPKKESILLGDYEMWIDKENWVVMKMIANSGDIRVITENTKVDLTSEINKEIFKLDIPKDAKKVSLDEALETESVTIEETYKMLGDNLLILKDKKFELKDIESIVLDPKEDTKQFTFKYTQDGAGTFEISVMETPEEDMSDLTDFGHEEKEVRGGKATVLDDTIRMVNFEEGGNYYMFMVYDGSMTLKEMMEVVEGMDQYK